MKHLLAVLLLVITPFPALAASWTDINAMSDLVERTGTKIVQSNCAKELSKEGFQGFYIYSKEQNLDHLVYCTENLDTNDPDAVWEVLSHEGTHIMQACFGESILKDEYVPRILRHLQTFAPHYYKLIQEDYANEHQRLELEAFYMELQEPSVVMDFFKSSCLKQ